MIPPPLARRGDHVREHHGDQVVDEYEWLRDVSDPEVIAYLTAENAYAEERLAHLAPLREALFREIKERTQETDLSVPVALGPWWYYARSVAGRQYALECRAPRTPGEPRPHLMPGHPVPGEQLLLDGNLEAGESAYFGLGAAEVSIDGDLIAFATDHVGEERFAVTVRRIASGEVIDTAVSDIGYGLVWSLDGRYLFFTRVDEAWRPHEVWRHEVGTAAEADVLVYSDPDERFWVGLGSSRDDRWVLIGSGSKTSSEVSLLDASLPLGTPRVVTPRREGVEYDVEVAGERLFITHNADHPDFDVAWAPLTCAGAAEWQPCRVREEGERVVAVDAFADFAVVSLRSQGLTALRVLPYGDAAPTVLGAGWDVVPEEDLYTIGLGANLEVATRRLQVVVESMVTPRSIYDYDVDERTWTLLKRRPVLGGYDPDGYRQRREWATAPDGTRVPVSIVHRAGVVPDGTNPGWLYGYGAYEAAMDPSFSIARLSMLDRGMVCAVAHVRGGGEMGRSWYEDGRLMAKTTTFTDFLACADLLVDEGWVAPDRLVAEGGSAGGLLIGAAINLAPQRFAGVHASVPFVDPLTTVLDPSLPLTVTEWEEWGDPLHDPEAYRFIKSYAPYENITGTAYPAILATTSLHDARVEVVEPAKWVARLRAVTTTDEARRPILLKTEMEGGHAGRSGRYDAWRQAAFELAFLIDAAGAAR